MQRNSAIGHLYRCVAALALAMTAGWASPAVNAAIISISSGSPADFGDLLTGQTPPSKNVVLSKSGGGAESYTATRNNDGITVTPASGTFASANNSTQTLTISLNSNANGTASSGAKAYTIVVDNTTTATDPDDTIDVTANVFQPGAPSANTTGPALGAGDLATITNAVSSDSGQRASVVLDSFSVAGDGFGAAGLNAGVTATGSTTTTTKSFSGAITFDSTGLLNGAHWGTLEMYVENLQSIAGAGNRDLNSGSAFQWTLKEVVAGNTGDQNAAVEAGTDLSALTSPLTGVSDAGLGTQARLLDGTLSVDRTITIGAWRAPVPGEAPYGADLLSDVFSVTFTGAGVDMYVLEATYDDSALAPGEEQLLANVGLLALGWWDGHEWVNAVAGNTGGTPTRFLAAYDPNVHFALGYYGVDVTNNTVWAVLDHASEFAALPEPATGVALLLGLGVCLARRPTGKP